MTANSEVPKEGQNATSNALVVLKKNTWAEDLLQKNLLQKSMQQISTEKGAREFFLKISTSGHLADFIKSEWTDLQKNSEYTGVSIGADRLEEIGLLIVRKLVAKVAIYNQKREHIYRSILNEYKIPKKQIQRMDELLSTYPSESLSSLESTAGRKSYLSAVFGNDAPLAVAIDKRMREKIWKSWLKLSSEDQNILADQLLHRNISAEMLRKVWKVLDQKWKEALLDSVSADYTLDFLQGIDSTVFSKEKLLEVAQKIMGTALTASPNESLESTAQIEKVVAGIEWWDIANLQLNGKEIIQLMSRNASGYSEIFMGHLEGFIRDAQLEESTLNAKNSTPSAYENADRLNAESLLRLKNKAPDYNTRLSGESLLLDESFRKGEKSIILTTKNNRKGERYFKISAGHNVSETEPELMSLKITLIGENGTIDRTIQSSEEDLTGIWGLRLLVLWNNTTDFEEVAAFEAKFPADNEAVAAIPVVAENIPPAWAALGGVIAAADLPNGGIPNDIPAVVAGGESGAGAGWNGGGEGGGGGGWNRGREGGENAGEGENAPAVQAVMAEVPLNADRFNTRLSEILGETTVLVVGNCISIGKPGSESYNIFRIIEKTDTGMRFSDGWEGGPEPAEGEYSFESVINLFKEEQVRATIIPSLASPDDLLSLMQKTSTRKNVWAMLELRKDDPENRVFDFTDRRFDTEKVRKHYFIGRDGRIIEITNIDGNTITARVGHDFKESSKATEASSASWGEEREYPLEFLSHLMLRYSMEPWSKPPREIGNRPVTEHTEHGWLRHAFGRLSVHDILSGGKKFFDELKHHLEHGSHLQEQRVMLEIANKMGMKNWNSEWYADFKSKYENEEKNLIEARLKTLGEMGTPLRQKSIRASLLNDGTHDYDHWTNALCMIEKHGNLYAGELQDLEGTWIFFKRIAGIPLDADINKYTEFQTAIQWIRNTGVDNITEEAVIEQFMKTDPHFKNSQIWRMVKKRVKSGTEEELANGKTEAEGFNTLDQRLNYALGKMKSREYAHAIGAMETIFEKEGPAYKKQTAAFIFAMSRIPERLPRLLIDKFNNIYDAGRLHSPALTFIKDRTSQENFRDTIQTLVTIKANKLFADPSEYTKSKGRAMLKSYKEMNEAITKNTGSIIKKNSDRPNDYANDAFEHTKKFWEEYGAELQGELTLTTGDVMTSEAARQRNPSLEKYVAKMHAQLGDTNIIQEAEAANGTPFMGGEGGAGVLFIRPEKILEKMGMQITAGGFSNEPLQKGLQLDTREALRDLRDNPDMTEDDKKALFKKVYKAFTDKIQGAGNLREFLKHPTVKPFIDLGLEPPRESTKELINTIVTQLQIEMINERAKLQIEKSKNKTLTEEYTRLAQRSAPPAELAAKMGEINASGTRMNESEIKIQDSTRSIQEQQRKVDTPTPFDETVAHHKEHFEACFERFKDRRNVNAVLEDAERRTALILAQPWAGEAPGEGPQAQAAENYD